MGRSIGELNHDNLSISPRYRVNNWVNARDANNWDEMINIFYDRIESRYLKPVRLIARDNEIGEFSGFSILAIDCLIIETLNQFYLGVDETVSPHKMAFWNFFQNSDHFKNHFSQIKAFTFYSHYRCGILHQAQTKLKSVVRIDQKEMIQTVTARVSDGLIVDRSRFHSALEDEIASYTQKLKNGDVNLRANFVTKMNIICGL
jgi:hypothetical protein